MGERTLALGMYPSAAHAERAVATFIAEGVSTFEISFLSTLSTPATSIGGTLSTLAGIDFLTLPMLPSLIAAGPLLVHLRHLESHRSMSDLAGVLTGLGAARHEAKRLEAGVRDGGTLVTIHCEGAAEIELAQHVMHLTGANEVATAHAGAVQSHSRVA